ncbi:MAG: DUF2971 domain-containing protein [Planctomycetes bacterium]|nr:DUF2971 domain-containing protein [Planctomycetota bacterium]
MFPPDKQSDTYFHLTTDKDLYLVKVIYEVQKQERIIRALLRTAESLWNAKKTTLEKTKRSSFATAIEQCLQKQLLWLDTTFKDPSFAEEREWRIVGQSVDLSDENVYETRPCGNRLVPYFPFSISEKYKFPGEVNHNVRSVILGPCCNDIDTEFAVKQLLKKVYGSERKVNVERSGIPFRTVR